MAAAKRKPVDPVRIEIRKNDTVRVLSGRDKGKEGRVLEVIRDRNRVLVEHVMMVKRHTRPNPSRQIKGGIAERESSIHISNVMLICPQCGPSRIAHKVEELPGGKTRRTRVCRKCGSALEKK